MAQQQPITQPQSDPKNRLQEFTQRAGMPLPVYQTYNESNQQPHLPQFRSRLCVDGAWYTSPTVSTSKKAAERNVAEHALVAVVEKIKNEARASVKQDTMLCKQIVNEYAAKINVDVPEYTTKLLNPMIPLFISSVYLNGATFTGDHGKNKKDAEHSAARAAILSILESETVANTMAVHVKSKFKHYEELMLQVKDSSTGQDQGTDSLPAPEPCPVSAHIVSIEDPNQISSHKRARVEPIDATNLVPCPAQRELSIDTVPQSSSQPLPFLTLCPSASTTNQISQLVSQPLHVFNRAKPVQTSVANAITPIAFVPASTETLAPVLSTSAKKRKKKKEKRKRVQLPSALTAGSLHPSQVPICKALQEAEDCAGISL